MNIRVLAEALADKVDDRQSQELLDHPSFTRDGFIKMFERSFWRMCWQSSGRRSSLRNRGGTGPVGVAPLKW